MNSISRHAAVLMVIVFCRPGLAAAQTGTVRSASGGYSVSGTVVSKIDGHPLARTRVSLYDAKNPRKFESLVTAEDGKFVFNGVPVGKYNLRGSKRGFISASYDQHEQFSTAIVTGAEVESEGLVLRLSPAGVIAGKVLDEAGDPVRHANVTLFLDDHSSGVDQIRRARIDQTDDQGAFEFALLSPGTYFVSASAKPWYAVHQHADLSNSGTDLQPTGASSDRSLDVAYPLTYYADVTDADSATPIPVRGGDRLQVDIHLNPVPSIHLLFRVPNHGNNSFTFPQLEQPSFDGSTSVPSEGGRIISPGVVEVTGVPAGRYDIRLTGPGRITRLNDVDLTKDGEEIDTSGGEALSAVKVSVQFPGQSVPSNPPWIALRGQHRVPIGARRPDAKGDAEFQQVPAGRYELLIWGSNRRYSISHVSAENAQVSGNSITLAAGSTATVSMTLVEGSINVEGVVKRAGKGVSGAMVVLVPKNPEGNRDLFRRDQSDLDGTFRLQNVIPGSYTVLAIENGWDLDWSQPGVITAYAARGRAIQVAAQFGQDMTVPDPVEVQSK